MDCIVDILFQFGSVSFFLSVKERINRPLAVLKTERKITQETQTNLSTLASYLPWHFRYLWQGEKSENNIFNVEILLHKLLLLRAIYFFIYLGMQCLPRIDYNVTTRITILKLNSLTTQ